MLFLSGLPLKHSNFSTPVKTLRAAAIGIAQMDLETAPNNISRATSDRK